MLLPANKTRDRFIAFTENSKGRGLPVRKVEMRAIDNGKLRQQAAVFRFSMELQPEGPAR